MKVTDLPLSGLKLVELDVYRDSRGFFSERYQASRFAEFGLPTDFVQDNHARSAPGVLRGLHYQLDPAQGKLVGVIRGKIWDVAVDIRPESPTFGSYFGIELDGDSGKLLWVPAGFAHGYCVLGDELSDVVYKVNALWNPKTEKGLRWDDPQIGIQWPIQNPVLSDKDRILPGLESITKRSGHHHT